MDDPMADQNIDLKTTAANDGPTPFEEAIRDARRGSNSGFPGDPNGTTIGTGPVYSTVGKTLTGDHLRAARAIQCSSPNGENGFGWVTHESRSNVFWSREGKLLGATYDGTGYSMTPGFGASLLNPVDLVSGAIAGKLVGRAATAAVEAAADGGSAVLRDIATSAAAHMPPIPPPSWIPRALRGGGRLWVTKGQTSGGLVARFVNLTRRDGKLVTILTGTHGDKWGRVGFGEWLGVEGQGFLREDIKAIARNGHAINVRVLDVTRLSEKELQMVLRGGGDIYAAWCNSSLARSINRAFNAVNGIAP